MRPQHLTIGSHGIPVIKLVVAEPKSDTEVALMVMLEIMGAIQGKKFKHLIVTPKNVQ